MNPMLLTLILVFSFSQSYAKTYYCKVAKDYTIFQEGKDIDLRVHVNVGEDKPFDIKSVAYIYASPEGARAGQLNCESIDDQIAKCTSLDETEPLIDFAIFHGLFGPSVTLKGDDRSAKFLDCEAASGIFRAQE